MKNKEYLKHLHAVKYCFGIYRDSLYLMTNKEYYTVTYFSDKPEWLDSLTAEEIGQILGGN